MATTTAFGWPTPDDTALVKDGASAIRTLGQAIDTSMADLEGGTTGQVLSKASSTDMDFTWVTPDDANAIQNSIIDAKGDLIAGSAADTPARLAVGTNGQVLVADSAETTGLKWATPSGGKIAQVVSTTKTDTFSASVAAGSSTQVTGLSATITPSSSSSTILVTVSFNGIAQGRGSVYGSIARGSTLIGQGASSGSRSVVGGGAYCASGDQIGNFTVQFVDSPATTSSTTYNFYMKNLNSATANLYCNRNETDSDGATMWRAQSTITVMELTA